MVNRDFNFDINKLLLISAFMTLIVDFIELLAAYQEYRDNLNRKNINQLELEVEEDFI